MAIDVMKNFLSTALLAGLRFCTIFDSIEAQDTGVKFYNNFDAVNFNNGSIVCIFQDNQGFLWFGTYGGLYRYDGHNFKEFLPSSADTNSLINSHVRSICQDSTGKLFIATVEGLCIYNPETEEFRRFVHNPNDTNSLINNTIYKLFLDKSGTIWVGTWGGGLDRIEKITRNEKHQKTVETYRFIHHLHNDSKTSISSNIVTDIAESDDSTLWIATQNGLDKYNKKTNEFYSYYNDPLDPGSLSNSNISTVCVDNHGNVWAGSWEYGLNLLNRADNKITRFIHKKNDENGPGNNIIMRLYCDLSGTVWVGTWGGGLDKITLRKKDGTYRFLHYENDKSNPFSISGNSIYSIFEDNTGSLWIGTDWSGLNKLNKGQDIFRHITAIPGERNSLVNNVVFALLMDSQKMLWIGTQNGLNTYDRKTGKFTLYQNDPADPNSLSHNEVRSIIEDKNGNIWIGTVQGLNKFNRRNNKFERYYRHSDKPGLTHIVFMHEDKKGILWLGTYAEGLLRFDPDNKTFREYIHDDKDPASISSDIVWAIAEDKNNILWIGTEKGGLCEFNPETGKFITYWHNPDDPKSITNSTIYVVKFDYLGNLWIGTISGLNKLLTDSQGKRSFARYLSNHVNGIAEDKHHDLWLLTNIGLAKFNPNDSSLNYYATSNRRQAQVFSANAILYDSLSDEIYTGGLNGYSIFYPGVVAEKSIPPITKIVNLRIFNKTVNVGEKVNNRIILPKAITFLSKLVFTQQRIRHQSGIRGPAFPVTCR